jgi:hypothetical protein
MNLLGKKAKKNKCLSISCKKINYILICLLFIIGAFHLAISNDLAIKGFEIKNLNYQLSLLEEKNSSLESELMLVKSYDNIKDNIDDLNLVTVNNVKYLNLNDLTMVKR